MFCLYIDDVFACSASSDEHIIPIDNNFEVLSNAYVTVNPGKN